MSQVTISSKKIKLVSDYNHFDLLPIKKFHECCIRIPETVILEKGFIKDWVFNSLKMHNHPILKKKKENISPLSVVKTFCSKLGYGPTVQGASSIKQIRDLVRKALTEQKDYDFVKDKKSIQILTVSNESLSMSLMDFLDYTSENKYSDQSFYDKWKMIQEKVTFTKIDEHYQVENIRHNHVIESKCQKIISVNTTQGGVVSTELEDDPYRKASPSKNFQIAETKSIEGYKFFDTFLNKKFFQMSNDLIEFMEKNLKCLVESVNTKFVINKDREPYLVGIYDLLLKPVKKIGDMKEFQLCREKGFIKVEEYQKFLEIYISDHMERAEYTIHTPISERRGKCRGKFCRVPMENSNLPPLLQQKLKMPALSANSRTVGSEVRDAVIKKKRRVLEKLSENKIVRNDYNADDEESSEYSTSGENEEMGNHLTVGKSKHKQLKICQNCFTFYFHINRFYELDVYGNLIEKKTALLPATSAPSFTPGNTEALKSKIQSMRKFQRTPQDMESNIVVETEQAEHEQAFGNKLKREEEENSNNFTLEIKPVTNSNERQSRNSKFESPMKVEKKKSLPRGIKSEKKLPAAKSKLKLDPLTDKKTILESGNPHISEKTNRIMTLTKLTQPIKLQERNKSKTMHQGMLPLKERRPDNHQAAIQQILVKFKNLPDSSRDELIYFAKRYYKDNLPQPLDRRCFSNYYLPGLYEFMSTSPIGIQQKRRIKKRPEMSLKRMSELTDYPEIVSRSEFVFETVIVNEQTTIPFCVMSTKVVNPDNLRSGIPFENIFIVNDVFDCFIEHISTAKELLEEDEMYNKRIILFNYPGQSHTIYNSSFTEGYVGYFGEIMDKLIFRLSTEKNELKIIDLDKDTFKFYGIGVGGFLLQSFLASYHTTLFRENSIRNVMLINSFMQFPHQFQEMLRSLLQLYRSDDPTVEEQAYLYYNKAINSEELSSDDLEHKAGLNPIRVDDRVYLLTCLLAEIDESKTFSHSISPLDLEEFTSCQVTSIYGRKNIVIPKAGSQEMVYYRNNPKQEIPKRVLIELDGGHDLFADNYDDVFRVMAIAGRK